MKSYFLLEINKALKCYSNFRYEIFQFVQYLYNKVHTKKKKKERNNLTKFILELRPLYMLSRIVVHWRLNNAQ